MTSALSGAVDVLHDVQAAMGGAGNVIGARDGWTAAAIHTGVGVDELEGTILSAVSDSIRAINAGETSVTAALEGLAQIGYLLGYFVARSEDSDDD